MAAYLRSRRKDAIISAQNHQGPSTGEWPPMSSNHKSRHTSVGGRETTPHVRLPLLSATGMNSASRDVENQSYSFRSGRIIDKLPQINNNKQWKAFDENLTMMKKASNVPNLPRLSLQEDSGIHDDDNSTNSSERVTSPAGSNKAQIVESAEGEDLIDYLNTQVIGRSLIIDTVFGQKLKLFCDFTASGQDLKFIVDTLVRVEDYYANTHTETSATGAYMNHLLNEAEDAILKAVKASASDYFVVGGGSGSTYAIEMAQKFLGTYIPPATKEQILKIYSPEKTWDDFKKELRTKNQLPLVIVSHYEHHSNEVTWRGQLCDVVETPPRIDGHVDLDRLETILKKNRNRPIIGSFSAGSNVTGIRTDVATVASILKRYSALAFFDYAAVGPYVAIDLSKKTNDGRCLIDGIFISPHKFLGGPGSCGVLVFNRKCYNKNIAPSHGGGGTVDYVSPQSQIFTDEPTHREKSGTPGILQIIKAGLAFQLKSALQPIIDEKEHHFMDKFYEFAANLRNLRVLGPSNEENRVCIFSFLIHHNGPKGKRYLHQNLIVKLLNDVFGIQGRSGCSCAGPYGHLLLNVDMETSNVFRFWVETHPELGDNSQISGVKPGWARVNLHYTMTPFELDYLFFAIKFLCDNGHRFLPVYNFDPVSGQWRHVNHRNNFPTFNAESLLADKRNYAESETMRQKLFEKQKSEAIELLSKLPPSRELDSVPEMPHCFFYVEKGMMLDRNLVVAKASLFNTHFEED